MNLNEICKRKKEFTKLSNQEIADRSGLTISTVNKFFSVGSKSPSIHTVGPICRVLRVSIDEIFDIQSDACTTESEHDLYERLLRSARHGIRIRNILLLGLTACLALVIIYALFLDSNLAGFGFIKR